MLVRLKPIYNELLHSRGFCCHWTYRDNITDTSASVTAHYIVQRTSVLDRGKQTVYLEETKWDYGSYLSVRYCWGWICNCVPYWRSLMKLDSSLTGMTYIDLVADQLNTFILVMFPSGDDLYEWDNLIHQCVCVTLNIIQEQTSKYTIGFRVPHI